MKRHFPHLQLKARPLKRERAAQRPSIQGGAKKSFALSKMQGGFLPLKRGVPVSGGERNWIKYRRSLFTSFWRGEAIKQKEIR